MPDVIIYMLASLILWCLIGTMIALWSQAAPKKSQPWPTVPTKPLTARECDIVGCTKPAHHFFAPVAVHRDVLLAVCDEHADQARLWVGKFAELPNEFGGDS